MRFEISLWIKLTLLTKNYPNSGMRGYVGRMNQVSDMGSEIFGAGLWFEVGLKFGVGLKFHMGQNIHGLTWIIFRVFID